MRGEQLCLRGIDTTDVYCFAKQIWGKHANDVDLDWFIEEIKKMGLDDTKNRRISRHSTEYLERAYTQFQGTPCRAGSSFLPIGLYPLRDLWKEMKGNFEGFIDELYDENGGTIFDPVPPDQLLLLAAEL